IKTVNQPGFKEKVKANIEKERLAKIEREKLRQETVKTVKGIK
ncbi:unnamed protein product, partial [marine sediment metagenome]